MRFYSGQHRFYCGIDWHTRTLSLCVVESSGALMSRSQRRTQCFPGRSLSPVLSGRGCEPPNRVESCRN